MLGASRLNWPKDFWAARPFLVVIALVGTGLVPIVQAVIALGHALDMHITAEGVERAEQVERLRILGCDSAQGHYFSWPLPVRRLGDVALQMRDPSPLVT